MFLETEACLDYGHDDLPPDLPDLGLKYHLHLPVDLPWNQGVAAVASAITGLERKIAFLQPWGYVLHPPKAGNLTKLVQARPALRQLLWVENTGQGDLTDIWDEITALDLGVCLDVGHVVSYEQQAVLDLPGLFERVGIMHVYGGESGRGHAGLGELPDPALLERIVLNVAAAREAGACVLVVEVFEQGELMRSVELLRTWMSRWGLPCQP